MYGGIQGIGGVQGRCTGERGSVGERRYVEDRSDKSYGEARMVVVTGWVWRCISGGGQMEVN